ncbi:hypothetical protein M9H77_18552 [Catharanthus roseus]|uniref:Uncharacterized protein n=1 Tax=Catharanthus roseus TaxID=4058 RepID=A0ACC0B7R8_CATRO|nr:hypothetical protein M9H77_18552 [Catharanthus roseus]
MEYEGTTESLWPKIKVSREERKEWCKPWKCAPVLRLLGRNISLKMLNHRLQELWKFEKGDDYLRVLEDGPWIVLRKYLAMSKWRTNLHAYIEDITSTMVWVYILLRIENHIGGATRVDHTTMAEMRGQFARVCVQMINPRGHEIDAENPFGPWMLVTPRHRRNHTVGYRRYNKIYEKRLMKHSKWWTLNLRIHFLPPKEKSRDSLTPSQVNHQGQGHMITILEMSTLLRRATVAPDLPYYRRNKLTKIKKCGRIERWRYSASLLWGLIKECDLIDLGSSGTRLTWLNSREGEDNIMEQLDHAFCNRAWNTKFAAAFLTHLPRTHLDHCPLLVNTTGVNLRNHLAIFYNWKLDYWTNITKSLNMKNPICSKSSDLHIESWGEKY